MRILFRPPFTPLVALLSAGLSACAAPKANPPQLFFTIDDLPAMRERIAATEWLSEVFAYSIYEADYFLQTPTEPYALRSETDPTTGIVGNGIGTAGRAVQHRLATLAIVGYLTGEDQYLAKGKELLLAVVRQTDPDTHAHWIKHLQSADVSQGLAYGYDFFGHLLSAEENAEVRAYLERIGQFLVEEDTTWGKPAPGVTSCNHNSVHYGALGLLALVLGEQEAWLEKARTRVRGYFEHSMDPTGYATEGHDYYGYGMSGAMPFAYALQRATGEMLWDTQPAFRHGPNQLVWKLMPFDGRMVALNDNPPDDCEPSGVLPALMFGNGVQLWAWWESLPIAKTGLRRANGRLTKGHTTFLLYLMGEQPVEPVHPAEAGLPLGHEFESGRVFLRNSWKGEDAAHVSFTSGYDFHRGHNHLDENSLTFAALGEAFIIDPGYMPKWTEQHTVITVNGAGMFTGCAGRIVDYREDPLGAFVRGQAEEAYDFDAALVGMADRKVYFVRGPQPYLVWRDDIALESDADAEFTSLYISDPKNELHEVGHAVQIDGYRGKASCRLHVFARGEPVKVQVDDLAGKTFVRRGEDQAYEQHLRRASATWVGHNPRFLSIALPYSTEDQLPSIEVDFESTSDEVICTLVFPDGRTDTLTFGLTDAKLARE